MTGLRTWRRVVKRFILFVFAWEIAVTIGSLSLLTLVIAQGGSPSPAGLIFVFGNLALYGVVIWAVRDAQGRRSQGRFKRAATVEDEV